MAVFRHGVGELGDDYIFHAPDSGPGVHEQVVTVFVGGKRAVAEAVAGIVEGYGGLCGCSTNSFQACCRGFGRRRRSDEVPCFPFLRQCSGLGIQKRRFRSHGSVQDADTYFFRIQGARTGQE